MSRATGVLSPMDGSGDDDEAIARAFQSVLWGQSVLQTHPAYVARWPEMSIEIATCRTLNENFVWWEARLWTTLALIFGGESMLYFKFYMSSIFSLSLVCLSLWSFLECAGPTSVPAHSPPGPLPLCMCLRPALGVCRSVFLVKTVSSTWSYLMNIFSVKGSINDKM